MDSPSSSVLSLIDEVEIRALSTTDIKQISDLHASLLRTRYTPQFFRQLILNSTRLCLVAHPVGNRKELIGFVSASIHAATLDLSETAPLDGGLNVQILTLGVKPAYQQNGLARRLVHAVVRKLRESATHSTVLCRPKTEIDSEDGTLVRANVARENVHAQKFYSTLGLAVEDEIRGAYRTAVHGGARDAYTLVGRVR